MKERSLLAVFFILIQFELPAQWEHPIAILTSQTTILQTSIDRLGNFYFISEGNMMKADADGKMLALRKDQVFNKDLFLEAWNPQRIILHQRGKHQGLLLGSSLETYQESITIDPAFAISPILLGNGPRSEIVWILDQDYSLKEIDLANMKILTESAPIFDPEAKRNFISLRLYQNFLFILEKDYGLHIVSRTGKLLRTIGTPHSVFGVLGEDFYYRENNRLVFEDIYSGDRYSIDLPETCDHVMATDERLVLVSGDQIRFFKFEPKQ